MTRWTPLEKPSERPASFTFWLGWASLVPLLAPAASVLACLAGSVSYFLCARYPERYTGRPRVYAGLLLCLLGMLLFFAEGALFLRWKTNQAYDQRIDVSRYRMSQISEALERYREEKGVYPAAMGIMSLKDALEPRYIAEFPVLDGFDQAISGESAPEGFLLISHPRPFHEKDPVPAPIVFRSSFQPAPAPPPPPVLPDANTAGNEPLYAPPGASEPPPPPQPLVGQPLANSPQ